MNKFEIPDWIDIHCHTAVHDTSLHICNLDSFDFSDEIDCGSLGKKNQFCFFSVGIHPWFIDRENIDLAFERQSKACADSVVLAVGECGLDKCIATPLEHQLAVFKRQIALSEQLGKPLVIHCVRAFNELQQLKKTLVPRQAWIVHGFNGHKALAEQLVKQGFYLSFGKALLQPESKASGAFLATPPERWFLETDDAADLQIGEIYQAAAKMAGLNLSALQELIQANFERVFRHD